MLHEVPAEQGDLRRSSATQLVLIGLSPITSDQGLNFVWVDFERARAGRGRGSNRGCTTTGRGSRPPRSQPVNSIAGVLTTFFVAWVEEQNDAAGAFGVLYLDQVQCAAELTGATHQEPRTTAP